MGSKKKKDRRLARAQEQGGAQPSAPPGTGTGVEESSFAAAKGPALRFLLIAGGFMAFFYGFFYTPPEDNPGLNELITAYLSGYASAGGFLLGLLGFDVSVVDQRIFFEGVPVRVVRGCDAMEPIAMFIAAILAVQVGSWRSKLIGLGVGVGLLVFANLLRIMALTYIRVRFPDFFDTAHLSVGQTLFILLTLSLWFAWAVWASRQEQKAEGSEEAGGAVPRG